MTIEEAIKKYKNSEHSTSLDNQLLRYNSLKTLDSAIENACYGRILDEKYSPILDKNRKEIYSDHYWNQYVQGFYGRKKLDELSWIKNYIIDLIVEKKELESARTFDDIYEVVNKITKRHKGFGDLYSYDVSLRIGGKLDNKEPCSVYLQRGAKDGYKILFPSANRIPRYVDKVQFDELDKNFIGLSAYKIENFLCVAKQESWFENLNLES